MFNHDNGNSQIMPDIFDPMAHFFGFLRIEPRGRLVQKQERGFGAQRAREFDFFAHAIGQIGNQIVAVMGQFQKIDHFFGSLAMRDLGISNCFVEYKLPVDRMSIVNGAPDQQILQNRAMFKQFYI